MSLPEWGDIIRRQGEESHKRQNKYVESLRKEVDELRPGDFSDKTLLEAYAGAIRNSACHDPREQTEWHRAEAIYRAAILERMSS
jgi:hypothetical protein